MLKYFERIAFAAAAVVAFAPMSHAATIDLDRGTLQCYAVGTTTHADCRGLVSGPPPVYSMTSATLYSIGASSEANEAAFLNGLLGTPGQFAGTDVNQTQKNGVASATYDVFTEHFVLKLGAGHVFLRNFSGSALTVVYNQKVNTPGPGNPGQGGGLSHESQVGQLSPVPLPAGLPLLAAGLGMLAWMRRKST